MSKPCNGRIHARNSIDKDAYDSRHKLSTHYDCLWLINQVNVFRDFMQWWIYYYYYYSSSSPSSTYMLPIQTSAIFSVCPLSNIHNKTEHWTVFHFYCKPVFHSNASYRFMSDICSFNFHLKYFRFWSFSSNILHIGWTKTYNCYIIVWVRPTYVAMWILTDVRMWFRLNFQERIKKIWQLCLVVSQVLKTVCRQMFRIFSTRLLGMPIRSHNDEYFIRHCNPF